MDEVMWSRDVSVNACKLIIQSKLIYKMKWQVHASCVSVSSNLAVIRFIVQWFYLEIN